MHIFVAVTAHGFGHLIQIAPVVNALLARHPGTRVTVQADLAEDFVATHLHGVARVICESADIGMLMDGPMTIRWQESLAVYRDFMAQGAVHRARQQQHFRVDRPDLVIADVPWLPLQVGAQMGIPTVGLCSLNWRDILAEGSHASAVGEDLDAYLRAAYRSADLFIRPRPCMPMPWLEHAVEVGPIARLGRNRRAELDACLGLAAGTRVVLVQFGGIPAGALLASWPRMDGVHWLLAGGATVPARVDLSLVTDLAFEFVDLVASVDALVTKPGYGSFAEAGCHALPTLYAPRGDWAEEPWLMAWLDQCVATARVSRESLLDGDFRDDLARLLECPRGHPVAADGIPASVALIEDLLAQGAD